MKKSMVLVFLSIVFLLYSCSEIEDTFFPDVKGTFKGISKEYLGITINISKQDKDKLEGTVRFEINQAKVPEGDTLSKYIPNKDSTFTGEIITSHLVLTTNEYTVKVNDADVNLKIVFNLVRSEDGKRLTGTMTFSGISDLGEVPIDVTKQ